MNSLERLVRRCAEGMLDEDVEQFKRDVRESVNLQARNTSNKAFKDLAEAQIRALAARYVDE